MSTTPIDPRRYFESVAPSRGAHSDALPVCLYLEVTNRCNLLCETCPRTFETLEPPADMSYELFRRIIDQVPRLQRAVLHGVGEPMLVRELPRMIATLKERGVYVLFNTNGTLLSPKQRAWLIESGLDELRISLDAADPASFRKVRGRDFFARIVRNVAAFVAEQKRAGAVTPAVSLWLTGLRETIALLPRFVELAATMGVKEVYLQRLVFDETGRGLATPDQALFDRLRREDEAAIAEAEELAAKCQIRLDASGATEPGLSLKRGAEDAPWSGCRRPWSLMYFTANGRALPCCIAPFAARDYATYTLGDARTETLAEIWNGPAYQEFRSALLGPAPPAPCRNCGLRWSL